MRFLLVAAQMGTPGFLQQRRLMRSILRRKASSITDGPKQKHDGGEGSHGMHCVRGMEVRQSRCDQDRTPEESGASANLNTLA